VLVRPVNSCGLGDEVPVSFHQNGGVAGALVLHYDVVVPCH
jgi:hypothetical protein